MKNLKAALLKLTFVTAILFSIASCSNNKTEDTKDVAEEHNDAKFDKKSSEIDAQFLVNAAEINLEEISLGQLAQQNGSVDQVKELGKMMEEAHTKSMADLTALAKTKVITLPLSATDMAMSSYKKLSAKSGADFGKSYSDMMVTGHKGAITLFEKASTECTDPDIKAWAIATLPALRTHLDHSMVCQKIYEKK